MGKEHFETGSGEGKGLDFTPGVIKPFGGQSPDVIPLQKGAKKGPSARDVQEARETGSGMQTEETIVERDTPQTGRTRATGTARRGRGSAQATMGHNGVATNLSYLHTAFSTLVNNARSVRRLSDTDHAYLDYAQSRLNDAGASHHLAHSEGNLRTNRLNRDKASEHLQNMASAIKDVHKTLKSSGVAEKMGKYNLNAPMPSDVEVDSAHGHAMNLPRQGRFGVAGATKPVKELKFGKETLPGTAVTDEMVKKAEEIGGKGSFAVQKLKAAQGTPRGKNAGISEEAEINPRRRGSGRRVDTRFSSDANKLGRTPKWEG